MKDVDGLIFDFDGTLVDTSEVITTTFNRVLEEQGCAVWAKDDVRRMIGRPLRDMFYAVRPDAKSEWIDECVEAYRRIFYPLSRPLSCPMPGLVEHLPGLAEQYRLGIATSRTVHGAVYLLDHLEFTPLFRSIIGIDSVEQSKPHREPLHKAAEEMGVPIERCLMIGDTRDDIEAGKNAGMRTIGISLYADRRKELQGCGADNVVADFHGLVACLDG
jgi:phosphoglycolate phosphatase-like HAD superfamily hydrolase